MPGFGQGNRIHVVDYGAAGDGATNDAEPIKAAVLALEELTGTLVAWPTDTYYIAPGVTQPEITIKASNITMDWQGATLTGKHYFTFNGDSGIDGDRSSVRSNVHFRNATLGDGGSTDTPIGPGLFWCDDSSVENVLVDGPPFSSPVFRVYMSKRCTLRDVAITSGYTANPPIGILLWHSEDTLVENCHIDGKGEALAYGLQVKGGYDNRIVNCSMRNVIKATTGSPSGFRDRGDSPWSASPSTGTYPYSGQGNQWNADDERRASHRTTFMNCVVQGCGFIVDFASQENTDASFINCVSRDSGGQAFQILRTTGTLGQEANTRLLNCVAETPYQHGIYVRSASSDNLLPNVLLDRCRVENARYNGIQLENTDRCKIVRCTVRNCATAGHATYNDGIWVRDTNNRPEIIGCESFDDQATATQRYGIYIASGTTYPRVEGCRCTGNTGNIENPGSQIQKDADGIYLNNSTDTDVIKTFDANDATPSVADGEFFKTANTSLTTITDFLDGTTGQKILVLIGDDYTQFDFSSSGLKGKGGVDWLQEPPPGPQPGDHLTCWYDGTDWYCDVSVNTLPPP
ncbi:MAG: right-handed parallel beta-helix repeat-containing protein [Planctomycetota bacterium]